MEVFDFNEKNIVRYCRWTSMIAESINCVGRSNHRKTIDEIGLKGFVFLDILQRIAPNLHGMDSLFREFIRYPEIRFSLNLVFRGILSDVLTGLYLTHFIDDPVSFENEVKVMDLDFAKFAKFIIDDEATLTGQIPLEGAKEHSEKYRAAYIKENEELFKDVDKWELKSHAELRATSKPELFIDPDHFKGSISDATKYKRIKHTHLGVTYLLFRYFSQYQHYSYKGRTTLSMPVEYDMQKYYVSFMMINESVHVFCKLIGAEDKDLELLRAVGDEYIIKK